MDLNAASSSSCSSSSLIRQPTSTSSTSISLHPSASFAGSTSLLSQRILTEEQYQSSLDYIIKRDFFPALARQRQGLEQSYLSALRHGDEQEIRHSLRRLVTEEERMGLVGVGVTPRDRDRDSQSVMNGSHESVNKRTRTRLDQSTISRQTGTTTPSDTPLKSQTSNWESTPISTSTPLHHQHHRHSSHSSISQSIENQAWKEQGIDLSLSLSQFQSRYTSEDNASFNSLMARNNLKKREKNSWAFEAERKANEKRIEFGKKMELESKEGRELMLKEKERRLLLLQDDKGQGKGNETKLIEMAKGKGKEQEQEGTDLVLRELEKDSDRQLLLLESTSSKSQSQPEPSPQPQAKDDRPSIFQSTKFKALNNFFFSPDSDISTNYSRNSSLPLNSSELASVGSNYLLDDNRGTSITDRPETSRDNIRLPKGWNDESGKVEKGDDDDDDDEGGGSSPSSSRIDRAIAGNISSSSSSTSPRRGSQSLSNLINSNKPSISLSTPRIAGYSFVSPLPTPRPGDLGEDRIKQLMTWGEIVGTPRRVDETPAGRHGSRDDFPDGDGDDEGNARGDFFIPNTPKRDELARKLSNPTYHSKHKYNTSSKGSTTPYGQASYKPSINLEIQSPRQSSIQNLSPAARNLFDKSIRKSGAAGGGLFGNARDGNQVGSKGRVKSSLGESLMRSRNEKDRDREVIRREREKELEKRRLDLSRKGWSPSPSPRPS